MAGWTFNPAFVLARLEVLVLEYPFLSGRGLVFPTVLMLVAPLASAGHGSRAWDAVFQTALCGSYAALLLVMHFYDLARRRVQSKAEARGAVVRRNCCFESRELQEAFEVWRVKGLFWMLLDWATVAFMAVFVVKLVKLRRVCRPVHQLWALGGSISSAPRALRLERLSSRGHSVLSLMGFTYSWVSRSVMLVNGDKCVVASLGSQLYSGFVASGVVMSIFVYIMSYLLNPVSQAFFPWKMASGVIGYTLVGYLHILRGEEGIDWDVDQSRWGLLVLVIGQVITSLVIFCVCTAVCETGMHKFILSMEQAAPAARTQRAGVIGDRTSGED